MNPSSEKKVRELIAAVSGRPEAELRRDQHLMVDLGIDSPKALQLMMDIEENLEIEIPDEAASRFERVGDLLDFVAGRTAS